MKTNTKEISTPNPSTPDEKARKDLCESIVYPCYDGD